VYLAAASSLSTRLNARRRRHLAIAGAVVLAALTTAPAAAAMPPMEATAPRPTSTSLRADTRPRTPLPGFVLDKGRFTGFDAPGAVMQTGAAAINNFGKIASNDVDADAAYHGFLRDRRGRFTTIDLPGALQTRANGHQRPRPDRRWLPIFRERAPAFRPGVNRVGGSALLLNVDPEDVQRGTADRLGEVDPDHSRLVCQ
jgi:hypothetical protein